MCIRDSAWAADVSEKGFKFKEGLAVVPEIPFAEMSDAEKADLVKKPHTQFKVCLLYTSRCV